MAGLNGSIVRGEENEESDIDFLILARAGRLYTTRFLATFFDRYDWLASPWQQNCRADLPELLFDRSQSRYQAI